jgi:hypothetical protein
MLKEQESFTDRLKDEITTQAGRSGVVHKYGSDAVMSINKLTQSLGEEETMDKQIEEKWSEKYKKSIDCNNPKGFSQKAHCQGKKKKSENKEATGAGSAGGFEAPLFSEPKKLDSMFKSEQPKKKVKGGFVNDETPKKVEATEATGAGSSGSYETTASWAKSMNKKDWRGASKTQIPGGKFVQVKKKCKKFPYCNQGDIKALKIWENKTLQKVITDISKKQNISESVIKNIIAYELGLI